MVWYALRPSAAPLPLADAAPLPLPLLLLAFVKGVASADDSVSLLPRGPFLHPRTRKRRPSSTSASNSYQKWRLGNALQRWWKGRWDWAV